MLGTGVFASWTPAFHYAGDALLIALLIAGVVAGLNAWSSVRLASAHPVSGGSYSYGRRWLGRPAALTAGFAFVVGKSASAGAAALTIGAYLAPEYQRFIGFAAVLLMLAIDLRGVTTSAAVSALLSAFVIVVLLWFVWVVSRGINTFGSSGQSVAPVGGTRGLLEAAAVLFVAFAGYARVTVLGEEVRDPRKVIPRAVVISLVVVLAVYLLVGFCVLYAADGVGIPLSSAPLLSIVDYLPVQGLHTAIKIAAAVAAGAALLSLIAGMGRTMFAMGHGGDLPHGLTKVSSRKAPIAGELVAAVLVLAVVLVGGIGAALALSAGSIGIYYAVAHLSAIRMSADEQPPPRWVPYLGLVGCAVLVSGALLTFLP
jgi:APA family basic amino acid/polyamine antiporter